MKAGVPQQAHLAYRITARIALAMACVLAARPIAHALIAACAAARARADWAILRAGGGVPPSGAPVAWLRAPTAGLDLPVRADDAPATLLRSPGRRLISRAAGSAPTTLIAAHRDKHFRTLGRLKEGDPITLETPDGRSRTFRVVKAQALAPYDVAPTLAGAMGPAPLALMTCYPFRFAGPAPLRWLVVATPVDTSS